MVKLTEDQKKTIRAFVNRVDRRLAKMQDAWSARKDEISNDTALRAKWFEKYASDTSSAGMQFANDDSTRFLSLAKMTELEDEAAGPRPTFNAAYTAQIAEDLK